MNEIEWIEPWKVAKDINRNLVAELKNEISPKHLLYDRKIESAIGLRVDCDEVLFLLGDNSLAVVNLTWAGIPDQDPRFPWTTLYSSFDDFIENAMIPDARNYGNFS